MDNVKKGKLAFGTDHAALQVRGDVKNYLTSIGYEVEDFGYEGNGSCDYPDYAKKVAECVAAGKAQKGILICGTGIGMAAAANKVKGVIAATVWDEDTAKLAAQHNKANVVCMGSRTSTLRDICLMAKTFLSTEFEARHQARVDKILAIEKN
jgi:ribose 5-phosphate isomerase B